MGFLYQLTSPSGKRYIGITTGSVARRWRGHRDDASRGLDRPIHRAIRKYGADSFTIETLAVLEDRELHATEIRAIAALRPEYNATAGGEGTTGWSPSEVTREKISMALQGRTLSCETRERIAESKRGRPRSSATKAKISKSQKGRLFSEEHRANLRAAAQKRWHGDTAKPETIG